MDQGKKKAIFKKLLNNKDVAGLLDDFDKKQESKTVEVTATNVKLSFGKSRVTVNLHGATIVSWELDSQPVLFLSSKAITDGSKAIRGGIPVVFPMFGQNSIINPEGKMSQHGFARNTKWNWLGVLEETANHLKVAFGLVSTEETKKLWPFDFKLTYTLTLTIEGEFINELAVDNAGDKVFKFQTLLHTYFDVPDATTARVTGFKSQMIRDKVFNDGKDLTQAPKVQTIDGEVDRAFVDCFGDDPIRLATENKTIVITTKGFNDCVVWNPWIEKAKKMADFGDEEYMRMVCVEVGNVEGEMELKPKEQWIGMQKLRVE